MDIATARSFFPGTRDRAFLDAACVSLMPIQAARALEQLAGDLVGVPPRRRLDAPHRPGRDRR
jgi:hypothetical protein